MTLNDFDPDNDAFHIVKVDNPAHGTATPFAFEIDYTPNPGFSGMDSFTYPGKRTSPSTVLGGIRSVNITVAVPNALAIAPAYRTTWNVGNVLPTTATAGATTISWARPASGAIG